LFHGLARIFPLDQIISLYILVRHRYIHQKARGGFMKYTLTCVFSLVAVATVCMAQPATKVQPTPRLSDGKVDFGGKGVWAPIWVLDWSDPKYVDKAVEVPFTPWGLDTFTQRRETLSKDDPEGYCLPPGVPRYTGTPYPFQLIQLADRVVILYEGASHMYRIVFMDGRKHSSDPNPTWLGESIGWWEGNDTLVVDTIGFNGRSWLDYVGHPSTEALHVVEKFRRPDYLTLAYEATIEDSKAYTKPWTTSFKVPFRPGWDLLEYVCLENNKDLQHLGTKEPK
jgi:hypothetical protein